MTKSRLNPSAPTTTSRRLPTTVWFAALLMFPAAFPSAARGDDGGENQQQPRQPASTSKASENYYKTDKFIPGEEVVTPTGKKMKVWSTAGPVEVSPPPQPFDDPSKQRLDGSQIIVDGAGRTFQRDHGDISGARPGADPAVRYRGDTDGAAGDPFERNTIKQSEPYRNITPEVDPGADPALGAQDVGSE